MRCGFRHSSAFLDQDVDGEQAREARLASIRATSIAADGKDPPELNEFSSRSELLYQCFAVVDTVAVAAPARHVDLLCPLVFEAGKGHCRLRRS